MPPSDLDKFSLAVRTGLPADLLQLRQQYPRETWAGHANLGEWVRFWLSRHRIFRDLGAMLTDGCQQLQDGQIGAGDFQPWFTPRLEFLFGHLELHHNVEEFHIFPAFARAAPALQRGFTLLEADHVEIHGLATNLHQAATGLAGGGGQGAAAETARALAALLQPLMAHLDDEEDLIVPIVLDRTEAGLGLF